MSSLNFTIVTEIMVLSGARRRQPRVNGKWGNCGEYLLLSRFARYRVYSAVDDVFSGDLEFSEHVTIDEIFRRTRRVLFDETTNVRGKAARDVNWQEGVSRICAALIAR